MKTVLIPNNNEQSREAAERIVSRLHDCGCRVVMPTRLSREYSGLAEFLPDDECFRDASLCIVIGGDGAVLHSAKSAALHGVPVLAVHTGRVGFLTTPEEAIPPELSDAAASMRTEKRSMLDVKVLDANGRECFSDTALNEAVISRGEISRIIELALSVDGCLVNNIRGDGAIISTPTGSTAYSMSAGGPIVSPEVAAILVTPICPYTLAARSVVFPDSAEVSAEVFGLGDRVAMLTVDGDSSFSLQDGMRVVVRRSEKSLELLVSDEASFNEKMKTKLFGIK